MPIKQPDNQVQIWSLVGQNFETGEEECECYALAYSHLPHGGWYNQGLNEHVGTKMVDPDSFDYRSAKSNSQAHIKDQIEKFGELVSEEFVIVPTEEFDEFKAEIITNYFDDIKEISDALLEN